MRVLGQAARSRQGQRRAPYHLHRLWGAAWVRVQLRSDWEDALASITEAVRLYELISEQEPAAFAKTHLAALHTFADVLTGLGRTDEAKSIRDKLTSRTDESTAS
jgi:hypothetical protein